MIYFSLALLILDAIILKQEWWDGRRNNNQLPNINIFICPLHWIYFSWTRSSDNQQRKRCKDLHFNFNIQSTYITRNHTCKHITRLANWYQNDVQVPYINIANICFSLRNLPLPIYFKSSPDYLEYLIKYKCSVNNCYKI